MSEQMTLVMEPVAVPEPPTTDTGEPVIIRQLPIIEEHLELIRDEVRAETERAMSLVALPETLQTIKSTRASLTKKFDALEGLRKQVKKAVMDPYTAFEAVYKDCVTLPFKAADADLKRKVDTVEGEIKGKAEEKLYAYFAELQGVHHLEWLTLDRLDVKMTMTEAKKKEPSGLMAKLRSDMEHIAQDVDAISTMDDAAEILAEYKTVLNVSQAIAGVSARHRRIEAERQDAERRAQAALEEAERQKAIQEAMPAPTVESEPLQAPVVEPVKPAKSPDDVLTLAFTVTATRAKLIELKRFLDDGGYTYE